MFGAEGKPVVIKKNIFERNSQRHPDISAEESRDILLSALYSPDLYGQNQKTKRPYNWIVISTKDSNGKNRTVLLEINPSKDNVEIVHWHYIDKRGLEKIRRQAEREDGQLLILPSEHSEEAGALSSPTNGLSSTDKDTNNPNTAQTSEAKNMPKDEQGTSIGTSHSEGERASVEEPKPIGRGVFGNIYDQFKGKVKAAFDFLLKKKSGDLLGVFHRQDLGDIDLVWGDYNGGLTHMIRRHIEEQNDFSNVEEMCQVIDDVIKHGTIVRENADKANIEYNGYRVSIRKTIRDEKGYITSNKNWIVTAFDKSKPKNEKRRNSSSETLSTPSTNQEADGVTLPSNEISSTAKVTNISNTTQASKEKSTPTNERASVDKQGNPINEDGSLKIEEIKSIDELTDEDFSTPTRNVQLPQLPQNVDNAIGAEGKPVVIKKNIFEKNHEHHNDLTPEQSRQILLEALYNPNMYGQNQKKSRPYNWILIHNSDLHSAIILEVNYNKDTILR